MKKIIIFGDSIAAGLFQGEVAQILDRYLLRILELSGHSDFVISNLGQRGDSTESGLKRLVTMDTQTLQSDYTVIILGINDAINIRTNQLEYRRNLEKIINYFSDSKVILVGPSYVDEAIKQQTDPKILGEYVQLSKEIAERMSVEFIDCYHQETSFEEPNLFIQEDGLHPSKLGYHFLSSLIAQIIMSQETQV